jgi:hypothetical protein
MPYFRRIFSELGLNNAKLVELIKVHHKDKRKEVMTNYSERISQKEARLRSFLEIF